MLTLQELRKRRNLTARELEERAGVGQLFVSHLETKATDIDNVRLGSAKKVATVLGVSLDEFYECAKATEPIGKAGNPNMVKGQAQTWRKKKND